MKQLLILIILLLSIGMNAQNANRDTDTIRNESPKMLSGWHNPLVDYMYIADPTAIEHQGRLYVYGTNDTQQLDSVGKLGRNTYQYIKSLAVISTDDMVNWTYHGLIKTFEIEPYALASWAPSILGREEADGKTHFYIYYSNSGEGVGVMTATSPVGPWTDPIRKPLVTRMTPGIDDSAAPFDPGAVIDENGVGWIVVGGGDPNPNGTDAKPGNTRIMRLGKDLTSIDGKAVRMDTPYHFEANELNYIDGMYVYTYNTNWKKRDEWPYKDKTVPTLCTMNYMTTTTPLDSSSWKYQDVYFKNPGDYPGFTHSNNHTHLHKYQGQWYLFYHALNLQEYRGSKGGFRSLCVDKANVTEHPLNITMGDATLEGVRQIKSVDPTQIHSAAMSAATQNIRFVETAVVGKMDAKLVDASNEGIICVRGVSLDKKLKKAIFHFTGSGSIEMRIGNIDGTCLVEATSSSNVKFNRKVLKDISNPVDLFFRLKSDDASLQFKDWSLSK